ncbi:MAG: thiamine-phosphate diphosphorylase [Beggiatoa sp. IS2]|nr:MAG: thiamine-phosphate diphosphorylase [Beggiatoa sp. IS2]
MQLPLRGLYAVTDDNLIPSATLVDTVERAIVGGAQIVQYRSKSKDNVLRVEQARALRTLCQKYHVMFIVNDDISLAQMVNADGVHLGMHDTLVSTARILLSDHFIIGVSCYNQLSLAQEAMDAGATYVAFGSFFQSPTKPNAVVADLGVLREARKKLTCPLVAIGGITPENAQSLITAGADCLAVIHGLFAQVNVTTAAQRYARLFNSFN